MTKLLVPRSLADYEAVFAQFISTNYNLTYDRWKERKSLASIAYENTLFYKGFLLQAAVRMHRQPSTTATPFVGWQGVQSKLTAGESAVEFVHFKYQGIDTALEGDTLYAAFILLPDNQPPASYPFAGRANWLNS